MKKRSLLFVLGCAALTLASCGGGSTASSSSASSSASQSSSTSASQSSSSSKTSSTTSSSSSKTPSSSSNSSSSSSSSSSQPKVISVSITSGTTLYLNESMELAATVKNSDDQEVVWTVDDATIASIDDGKLVAKKTGTVNVTATSHADDTKSATQAIKVLGVDIFMADDGAIAYGEESSMKAGSLIYWGESGATTVTKCELASKTITMDVTKAANWYGAQLFYKAYYAEAGDNYRFQSTITSTVAGSITIDGTAVELEANVAKKVAITYVQGAGSSLSIQLGVNGGSAIEAGTVTFADIALLDVTETAIYHYVNYVNGEESIGLQVKDGKLALDAGSPAAPEGKIFAGWYNGDTLYVFSTPVTTDLTLTAKFINEADATKYSVSFYVDGTEYAGAKESVLENHTASEPDITPKWGYKVGSWYTDQEMTKAFSFDTTITADTTLYGKSIITPSATFMNTQETGWVIPATNMSYGDEGQFIVSGIKPWAADSWVIQANFTEAAVGTSGKVETISFAYKANVAGAKVNLYDNKANKSYGGQTLALATDWTTVTIKYDGGVMNIDNKLSFELGAIAGETNMDIEIKDLVATEGDPEPSLTASASATSVKVGGSAITVTATASNFAGTPTYSFVGSEGYEAVATVAQDTTDLNKFTVTPVAVGEMTLTIKATYDSVDYTADPITIKVLSADAPDYVIPDDAYEIKDSTTFFTFFDKAATNVAKNAYLSADIDLDAAVIGDIMMAGEYSGIFEGQGHTISNFTASRSFFNIVGASGIVRNFTVSCDGYTGSGFGVVGYKNNGSFLDVDVSYVTAAAINTVGAVCLNGSGSFEDCDSSITVNTGCNTLYAIANAAEGATFTNCTYFVDGTDGTAATAVAASADSGVTLRASK